MRLHRLRVQAFQAFGGAEEVLFDALCEAGLFLVHGDTGAGKTSLLDAVVFALYGQAPGVRGGAGARHRSDHAAPDVPTEVELEATLRGTRVRIVRRPRQERPKLRGGGTTEEQHSVRVWEVAEDGSEEELARRHDEADLELGRLLGMTRDQFCQVVLLPQGAFADFLRASSDGRRDVLERLFSTERFTSAEHWLAGQAKAADREYHEALEAARGLAARVAQAAGAEPPQDWERDPAALGAWVGELTVPAAAEEATAQAVRHSTREARAGAEAALAAGRDLAARRARAATARDELAVWEARRTARDAADAEREAATRAAAVAALLEEARARTADLLRAERAADGARTAVEGDQEPLEDGDALSAAPPQASGAPTAPPSPTALPLAEDGDGQLSLDGVLGVPEASRPTLAPAEAVAGESSTQAPGPASESAFLRARAAALRARAGAVAALAPTERGVVAGAQALALQEAELRRARAALAAAEAAADAAPAALATAETAVRAAREARPREAGLAHAEREARARAQAGARRDALAAPLRDAERGARDAADAELTARRRWLDLRERRLAGMAVHLAAQLEPGAPCPVCGAEEHPAPAAPEPGAAPAAGEAEEAAAQRAQESAAAARSQADAALARLRAELAGAQAVAGDTPLAELTDALAAAGRRHADALELAAGLGEAEEALTAAAADLAGAGAARERAATAVAGLDAAWASARDALEADRAALAAALGGARDVASRVAALTRAADRRDAAADALEALGRATQEAARAGARAEAAARAHDFPDAAAARAAVRPAERVETLAGKVQAFDAGLAERRARAQDPDLAAAAAAPAPDLAGIEAAWRDADAAACRAEATAALAARRARELQELDGQVEAALEVLGPRAERRRAVRDLARLADGSAEANVLRMRLSAYVLAARLEEVAAAATVRLEAMSAGRYTLVHCDEGARGRRRGGLDLRVVDGWTGQERAPATLSGGETFFASLALALGLADVVAQEAGGARLETLFVDEGFGSLDERTLEHVLEVLDRLRDGGRTVGIVSHVADLRDRIPAQLRVVKERTGSRVEHLTPA